MQHFWRFFALLLVVLALVSGYGPGSDARCSCSSNALFAQTTASASAAAPVADASAPAQPTEPPAATTASAAVSDQTQPTETAAVSASAPVVSASEPALSATPVAGPLPKMVDLGAGKCKACKQMEPVLEEAKKLYQGKAEVVFIDVWENREAGSQYGIRMIPTQVFFDRDGKEVYRHEGFLPLEDIQKQFEALGVKLTQ